MAMAVAAMTGAKRTMSASEPTMSSPRFTARCAGVSPRPGTSTRARPPIECARGAGPTRSKNRGTTSTWIPAPTHCRRTSRSSESRPGAKATMTRSMACVSRISGSPVRSPRTGGPAASASARIHLEPTDDLEAPLAVPGRQFQHALGDHAGAHEQHALGPRGGVAVADPAARQPRHGEEDRQREHLSEVDRPAGHGRGDQGDPADDHAHDAELQGEEQSAPVAPPAVVVAAGHREADRGDDREAQRQGVGDVRRTLVDGRAERSLEPHGQHQQGRRDQRVPDHEPRQQVAAGNAPRRNASGRRRGQGGAFASVARARQPRAARVDARVVVGAGLGGVQSGFQSLAILCRRSRLALTETRQTLQSRSNSPEQISYY